MGERDFKIHSIDNGFCRINYKAVNHLGETIYYCLQDEGENYGGVICYRCATSHGLMEPSYPIAFAKSKFEVPQGNSDIEIVVRNYLENK